MSRNDITGDRIASRPASKLFRDNYDAIFGKAEPIEPSQCGDCGGTRKVDGRPCPACAPTDDGPGKESG